MGEVISITTKLERRAKQLLEALPDNVLIKAARQLANDAILDRMRGVPANPATPESENDPLNPNASS